MAWIIILDKIILVRIFLFFRIHSFRDFNQYVIQSVEKPMAFYFTSRFIVTTRWRYNAILSPDPQAPQGDLALASCCLCCRLVIVMVSINLGDQPPKSLPQEGKQTPDSINERCRPRQRSAFQPNALAGRCSDPRNSGSNNLAERVVGAEPLGSFEAGLGSRDSLPWHS